MELSIEDLMPKWNEIVNWFEQVAQGTLEKLNEIIESISDWISEIISIAPCQRYTRVKKIYSATNFMFFNQKPIYRCRNNC